MDYYYVQVVYKYIVIYKLNLQMNLQVQFVMTLQVKCTSVVVFL